MAGGPPGVVSVVQRGSQRQVFRHGVANRATGQGISLQDRWRIASVSKAFSGAVALQLVAQGRLSLDGGGKLVGGTTRPAQLQFRQGGGSDPPGPGHNAAGLALFRYRTRCGTVYGHTGNIPGYTDFLASSPDGRRSVTVQASTQLDWDPLLNVREGSHAAFRALRHTFELGVCSALA